MQAQRPAAQMRPHLVRRHAVPAADLAGAEEERDDRQRGARITAALHEHGRLIDLPIRAALGVRLEVKLFEHQNSFKNTTSATKPFCRLRPIVLPRSRRSSVPHGPTVWPAMPRPWNGSRL